MSENALVPQHQVALPEGVHGDASLLGEGRPRILTSIDMTNPLQRKLMLAALSDITEAGREALNKELLVSHFVLRTAKRRSLVNGELEPCVMLVLISPGGSCWATTSETCIESWHLTCQLDSYPPYNPPRKLLVRPVKTRGGFETYKLQDVTEAIPASRKSK